VGAHHGTPSYCPIGTVALHTWRKSNKKLLRRKNIHHKPPTIKAEYTTRLALRKPLPATKTLLHPKLIGKTPH
jgi:hypothetical protein